MKILIKIFVFIIFFNVNTSAAENKIFGSLSYWDNLKQVQKNFYMKGALDAWGYYIWNNANDTQRDLKSPEHAQKIQKNIFFARRRRAKSPLS